MLPWPAADPATVAKHLGDEEVHLWLLPYQRPQGRAPLLALLQHYLDALGTPQPLRLETDRHGRPGLAGVPRQRLDFNWSHSGPQALLAVARGVAPGVDLEQLRPRRSVLEIAERYFAPSEAAALHALDGAAAQEQAFLRLWTAKEALLKAIGRGLAFGLERLSLSVEAAPRLLHFDGECADDWQLHYPQPPVDCLAALAWRGAPRALRAYRLALPAG